ncbi:DUF3427 domain-containing protein [Leptospira kemamanensis]|uniref:DUF3427 domain-containing protein n=1 Tax=Leptospira kemamanensis TaxID=2484942 RepID=A0A4R9JX14_9LEPT|nr:DEAD/DEAH box helicase [Leptospira kemamanensis]TGL57002.1 DUF3427 domain-containing protein [Leptospira kemamanensis]
MNSSLEELQKSLKTGFINEYETSLAQYRPQLLVNDRTTKKKVLSKLTQELRNCKEFWISTAFATTSGVACIMNSLLELKERKIKGKILVSQYLNFTHPEALKRLLIFDNIELRIATEGNLHSKGYFFNHGNILDVIIGSSNLTANALSTNKEWNLKVSAGTESELAKLSLKEFHSEFDHAIPVDSSWINEYNKIYTKQRYYSLDRLKEIETIQIKEFKPNLIQAEALQKLRALRAEGKTKALIVSATGTGKTFLSAFDVQEYEPKKFMFIVHRTNIAKKAMETFKSLMPKINSDLYSGGNKNKDADFIFATIQTISKDEHLKQFSTDHFDYIVIDETHHAEAVSYQKVMDYFKPKFLLGMTATPERTDGINIFSLFDHNIAYEIRLQQALEQEMLAPFHYYGVSDLEINGERVEDKTNFNLLIAEERVNRLIETSKLYGTDNGVVRGLIFCSRIDEAKELSKKFNDRGFKTVALTGEDSESFRHQCIKNLEEEVNSQNKLDYIFSVDIFNEGIDIPKVNQIIMLRPTQSAIVFVQQLGRGLRKTESKEYLTVIDFIGNYANNYMIPIALFGDVSYNKDNLRKLLLSGSEIIPGSSTINFDKISKDRIYDAISEKNFSLHKDLLNDYQILKFKIGKIPNLCDFWEQGSRDPYSYITRYGCFYNFLSTYDNDFKDTTLSERQIKLLELFSKEINNSKRIEETILLELLLEHGSLSYGQFREKMKAAYGYEINEHIIKSCISNLNFNFVGDKEYKNAILSSIGNNIQLIQIFIDDLENSIFKLHLLDTISLAKKVYGFYYKSESFIDGFTLYRKYSRKDVHRILNWESNPNPQNVGGYVISKDKSNCPVFVTYHKGEDIPDATKYEDIFLDNQRLQWMSKNKRTRNSPDVTVIENFKTHKLRIPLFIKKKDDIDGREFYFMGDCEPIEESFEELTIADDDGKQVPIVRLVFHLSHPVEDKLYEYLMAK